MTAYTIDNNADLPVAFDWRGWLRAGETIDVYTATGSNCTVHDVSNDAGLVTYWITDCVHPARVTVHVETSLGRVDERSDFFTVKRR